MEEKYFATVFAVDRPALLRLQSLDLDLFHQTASVTESRTVRLSSTRSNQESGEDLDSGTAQMSQDQTIEALLTLEQVGRLVSGGYEVLVSDTANRRSRAAQVMDFADWLKVVTEG